MVDPHKKNHLMDHDPENNIHLNKRPQRKHISSSNECMQNEPDEQCYESQVLILHIPLIHVHGNML